MNLGQDQQISSAVASCDGVDRLSILTYNVGLMSWKLLGINFVTNPPFIKERLVAVPDALKSSDADIIALQEIYDDSDARFVADAVSREYPFCARQGRAGILKIHNGLMILSKFPLIRSKFHPYRDVTSVETFFASKGCLEASFLVPALGTLTILNVHTASATLDPDAKEVEVLRTLEVAQTLELAGAARARHEWPLVVGDLNAGPEASVEAYEKMLSGRKAENLGTPLQNDEWEWRDAFRESLELIADPTAKLSSRLGFERSKVLLSLADKLSLEDAEGILRRGGLPPSHLSDEVWQLQHAARHGQQDPLFNRLTQPGISPPPPTSDCKSEQSQVPPNVLTMIRAGGLPFGAAWGCGKCHRPLVAGAVHESMLNQKTAHPDFGEKEDQDPSSWARKASKMKHEVLERLVRIRSAATAAARGSVGRKEEEQTSLLEGGARPYGSPLRVHSAAALAAASNENICECDEPQLTTLRKKKDSSHHYHLAVKVPAPNAKLVNEPVGLTSTMAGNDTAQGGEHDDDWDRHSGGASEDGLAHAGGVVSTLEMFAVAKAVQARHMRHRSTGPYSPKNPTVVKHQRGHSMKSQGPSFLSPVGALSGEHSWLKQGESNLLLSAPSSPRYSDHKFTPPVSPIRGGANSFFPSMKDSNRGDFSDEDHERGVHPSGSRRVLTSTSKKLKRDEEKEKEEGMFGIDIEVPPILRGQFKSIKKKLKRMKRELGGLAATAVARARALALIGQSPVPPEGDKALLETEISSSMDSSDFDSSDFDSFSEHSGFDEDDVLSDEEHLVSAGRHGGPVCACSRFGENEPLALEPLASFQDERGFETCHSDTELSSSRPIAKSQQTKSKTMKERVKDWIGITPSPATHCSTCHLAFPWAAEQKRAEMLRRSAKRRLKRRAKKTKKLREARPKLSKEALAEEYVETMLEAHTLLGLSWDPLNPLNALGPHWASPGQRCDHVFLPDWSANSELEGGPRGASEWVAVRADLMFTKACVELKREKLQDGKQLILQLLWRLFNPLSWGRLLKSFLCPDRDSSSDGYQALTVPVTSKRNASHIGGVLSTIPEGMDEESSQITVIDMDTQRDEAEGVKIAHQVEAGAHLLTEAPRKVTVSDHYGLKITLARRSALSSELAVSRARLIKREEVLLGDVDEPQVTSTPPRIMRKRNRRLSLTSLEPTSPVVISHGFELPNEAHAPEIAPGGHEVEKSIAAHISHKRYLTTQSTVTAIAANSKHFSTGATFE